MLSIGEFSRVTEITIKALRLYHEKGILVPDSVDESSGYRYYGHRAVERAMIVKRLKEMGFSLEEIKGILDECQEDGEVVARVESKLAEVEKNIRRLSEMKSALAAFLLGADTQRMKVAPGVVIEEAPEQFVCGHRFRGKYQDIGAKIGPLYRACGRVIAGPSFSLYYDGEYRDDDADIEICFPVRQRIAAEGYECRILAGGKAATIIHRGPYATLSRSYQRLFEHCADRKLRTLLPIREEYLKAPGFIFKGNPNKYLTKLMVLFEQSNYN